MSGSVNKCIIVGNLTRDPEIRHMTNGGKVANMSVATSDRWTDKGSGERKERSEYHRVAIFSEPLVKVAENYLRKGSKVYIEGQLETRKWTDQSGSEKYSTEVVLRPYRSELTMLDGASGDAPRSSDSGQRQSAPGGGYGGGMEDDSIPFACEWRV